jgi:hypothetical protein
MGIRRPTGPVVTPRKLRWAPPALTNPVDINISADSSNRVFLTLDTNTDYRLIWPSTPVSGPSNTLSPSVECLVQITGGRNIVSIGGTIDVGRVNVPTEITALYADGAPSLGVTSTAGFPPQGYLNVGGYQMIYTSTTPTSFNGISRRTFQYVDALPFPLPVGLQVWKGEISRNGISFVQYTGTIHVEGLLITGDVIDAIRLSTLNTGTAAQIQNVRVDRCVSFDGAHSWDGHPDVVSSAAGPTTIRYDRVTGITNGRGIMNKPDNGNDATLIQATDCNFASHDFPVGGGRLFDNYTAVTTWEVDNCWGLTSPGAAAALTSRPTNGGDTTSNLESTVHQGRPIWADGTEYAGKPDFVPEGMAGIGYVSPGYLT